MQYLGVIPARYQSSRLPGKPLITIDGKTMIRRVWEIVSKTLDNVVVATDDSRILNEVEGFGGLGIMTDPNHKSGTDRCAEAVQIFQKETGTEIDVVLNIQGDEPFIDPAQVHQLLEAFSEPGIQIVTLIKKITNNADIFEPGEAKVVIDQDKYALYFSRSPIPYCKDHNKNNWVSQGIHFKQVGMYGFSTGTLLEISKLNETHLEIAESLEQLRWMESGFRIKTVETDFETLTVDTVEDLIKMKERGFLQKYILP